MLRVVMAWVRPIFRSISRSSSAPASQVKLPPAKSATTWRGPRLAKSIGSDALLQCVFVMALLLFALWVW